MRVVRNLVAGFSACLTLAAAPASASLIGDSIDGCLGNAVNCVGAGFFSSPTAIVTDPGIEFSGSISDDVISADFGGPSGTTLTLTFRHLATHAGSHTYLNFGMEFDAIDDTVVGLTLLAGNTLPITASSFGAHSLDIDFTNVVFPAGSGDSTLTAVFQISAVPEPSSLALLAAAAFALSFGGARRKQRS